MKLYRSIIILFILPVFFTQVSCKKDFLERTPGVDLPEDSVFADPILASEYANYAYTFLIDDYARFNDHAGTTSQASDEAVSGNLSSSVRFLNLGLYHDHSEKVASLNDISDVWEREYAGIRVANIMLSKIGDVPWTAAQSPVRIDGEMHFLRAFFYFELIKRFGGVPIIDHVYGANDDIDIPRNTYDECVSFILQDLDIAEQELPADYGDSDYGRATLGAAKALRARALLYAASPLNNEPGDKNKWKLAADAARAVMEMNKYSLQDTYNDILNVPTSPEYIMIKIRGPRVSYDNKIKDFAMSPGSGGINGQMNPTQNHVDMYEMTSGKKITDPDSGYDPQNPYANRDPRLTGNVLYNNELWQGRRLEMWNGGKDYQTNNPIYTVTRYYCRKMWPEAYTGTGSGTALLNFIFFRYAEVLLNYAEAQNEATGPDASVYDAINQIRNRTSVQMPPVAAGLTQAQMREVIRHERAIELAFEDFRWYDIMRWKIGTDVINQPVYGMNVEKNTDGSFTYSKVLLPSSYQKVFTDKQNLYPIPRTEIYKSKDILKQNPDW